MLYYNYKQEIGIKFDYRNKKGELHMRDINTVRKAVATMANQLHKLGYSLSQAFKTAWKRVKYSMKCTALKATFFIFYSG